MAESASQSETVIPRPPVRRRWAMLLMLLPILLFFAYWGRLAYQAQSKRPAAPAPATAEASPTKDWPTLQKELAEGKLPLTQQQKDLWAFLESSPAPAERVQALRVLGEVQLDLLYSTEEGPGKRGHLVEQGQSLATIAQKYGSTIPAIVRANNLLGTNVQPGQHLVVPELGTIELRASLTGGQLVAYWQGRYLKAYNCSGPGGTIPNLTGQGTVAERRVVKDGKIIPFGQSEYFEAEKTLKLSWGNIEIKSAGATTSSPAPILHLDSKESLEEIFPLLTASTPVIISE